MTATTARSRFAAPALDLAVENALAPELREVVARTWSAELAAVILAHQGGRVLHRGTAVAEAQAGEDAAAIEARLGKALADLAAAEPESLGARH